MASCISALAAVRVGVKEASINAMREAAVEVKVEAKDVCSRAEELWARAVRKHNFIK